MWGQRGEFLIEANGMRVLVNFEAGIGHKIDHFEFHAVDLNRPFISGTGYRSHYVQVRDAGVLVDAVATLLLVELIRENKPVVIDDWHQDHLSTRDLPAWLMNVQPVPYRESAAAPEGFERVEVFLPAHQAFIARKWADLCKRTIRNR